MNKQEIFDAVATHVHKQGQRAVLNNTCQYQIGGLKCAVGALMNEKELAFANGRRGAIDTLLDCDFDKVLRPFFKKESALLYRLQRAHDFDLDPIKITNGTWNIIPD